jgi:cytochrome c peroxidase
VLSARPLERSEAPALVALSSPTSPPGEAFARGRALFHRAGDPRIAKDGRACASCHVDGLSDNLVWRTKRGPRSTPVLAGRLERTGRFGWNGESSDLAAHVSTTIKMNLGGSGISPDEIVDLVAYLQKLPPSRGGERTTSALVHRGEQVFASSDAGCAECHRAGGRGTDAELHVVTSAGRGAGFLTPPLAGLGRSAPYFHDGRYATLDELLTKTDGVMGSTRGLSSEDRSALLAYLGSL